MKNIKLLTVIGILLCLMCVTIAAANDENLPTQEEVTDLLEDSDSASDVMESVKEDHPTWKADLLECTTCTGDQEAIALYYEDSNSSKGHGSVYFKDGDDVNPSGIVSPSNLSGYKLKECYKGELEDSDDCADGSCNTEPEDEEKDTDADSDEEDNESDEDTEYTYEALGKALDDYDGTITCSSKKCATALSDYLEEDGWTASVEKKTFKSLSSGKTRYCVSVDTDDEGEVYIVLGA